MLRPTAHKKAGFLQITLNGTIRNTTKNSVYYKTMAINQNPSHNFHLEIKESINIGNIKEYTLYR